MSKDNIISLDGAIRAEIRRDLTDVMGLHGFDLEVDTILDSWEGTIDDRQVREVLRIIKLAGFMFDEVPYRAD
ncbi:MAG: hypothetical protein EOR84_09020 [Mesorhizobium sp.]|uniref:hypothetical protein n=1 Tax=Mesorhizobium sp. TaxID=1871066 RepID=UPI000FE9E6D9|nr:hypothetical protein [Mesorhizobium sp.]RWM99589.1 MAG: hypothetical protein EOR84_09020 [Mesorhizobium sp.]